MLTIIKMKFINILFCIVLSSSSALSTPYETKVDSIKNESVIEFYHIKLSKNLKELAKSSSSTIKINQIIENQLTDSVNLYEITYINNMLEGINWVFKKNKDYYYFEYTSYRFGFGFKKITELEFNAFLKKKRRLIKKKNYDKNLILDEVTTKINDTVDSTRIKILNYLINSNQPMNIKGVNINLIKFYKIISNKTVNNVLLYMEGYSQYYEIYLEDKSDKDLIFLLDSYQGKFGTLDILPKAFVIAKVLFLRTGEKKYLKTLRKIYNVHSRLIKEGTPEYYEDFLLNLPLEDQYFKE